MCKFMENVRSHSPSVGGAIKFVDVHPLNSIPAVTRTKLLHCVRTACILRTQRPGYSPKNTCHLTGCTAKHT